GKEGEDTHGVDVRSNFLAILEAACALNPDELMLSGDLCFMEGEAEIYDWIRPHLEKSGVPYRLISGNHDDPTLMAKAFGLDHLMKAGELYYRADYNTFPTLFLDTTTYEVSQKQLDWLSEQLKAHSGDWIIFMYHPPLLAGVRYMDDHYPLKNHAAVLSLFQQQPGQIHVFCGHYHVERVVSAGNVTVYVTPSCFFQIHPYAEAFTIDHYRIGFREIELRDGQLLTTVRYL
ncbi:MAG: metallophosphoesterase, partial [Saprospiraceae bacterium]|nr:metallophosphoesterase [Saprospiraceae bacterium]